MKYLLAISMSLIITQVGAFSHTQILPPEYNPFTRLHEEAHFNEALGFGLNPSIDYDDAAVYFDGQNLTPEQDMDISGAGVEAELNANYLTSHLRLPNNPYPIFSLWNNFYRKKKYTDGWYYSKASQGYYDDKVEMAMILEPLIMLGQLYCWKSDSPFFLHSRYKIDREGFVGYYSFSYFKMF